MGPVGILAEEVARAEQCSTNSRLTAVLLNPASTTTGARTVNAVARAGRLLGYETVEIANLYAIATTSVIELNASSVLKGWCVARTELRRKLAVTSAIIGAWGLGGLSGCARRARESQVDWLLDAARQQGIATVWMVGGEPRHPSRWHQYVCDKHGRTAGGTFDDRLRQVLVPVPIA